MRFRLSLAVLMLTLVALPTSAQQMKRVPTETGFEEYWTNIAAGGRDSLYHRVQFTQRLGLNDTLVVRYRGGVTHYIPCNNDLAVVGLELRWFHYWVTALQYPSMEERVSDRGWQSWLVGNPRVLLRARRSDIDGLTLKHQGIELPVQLKLLQ